MKTVLYIEDVLHTVYNPVLTYLDYKNHETNNTYIEFSGRLYFVKGVSVSLEDCYDSVGGHKLVKEVLRVKLHAA